MITQNRKIKDRLCTCTPLMLKLFCYHFIAGKVMKFVCDLQQVGGFLRVLRFPPPIKTERHDITEILSKVALNYHNPNHNTMYYSLNYLRPLFSIALIVEVAKTNMMAREI